MSGEKILIVEDGQITAEFHESQRRMKDALRQAEMRYRDLFEQAFQGVFRTTSSGKFIEVNASLAHMIGYDSPEEMMRSLTSLKKVYVRPGQCKELLRNIREKGYVKDFESQVYRRDGTKIWLSHNTRAVLNSDNKVVCYEGIVNDITERKQAEETLNALLVRQEALLDAVPDIIMEVNKEKVYTWANAAGLEFFGKDVIGKEASHYFEGEQDTYEKVKDIFSGDQSVLYLESWQRRHDGQKRLLAWWCRVLKNESGKVIGALSSARDITDSRLAELERSKSLARQARLNQLQQALLCAGELIQKLKTITDGIVNIFEADFCRIWLLSPGDLCKQGCLYAANDDGPDACLHRDKCLRLVASSGRYTGLSGEAHQRIPLGVHKIGRIASGNKPSVLTNDVKGDAEIDDHLWTERLGLASFAGYQLRSLDGDILGVMGLFSTHAITPEVEAQLGTLSNAAAQLICAAQAEQALRESEERFRLIAETIDEIFWIFDTDQGVMTYVSPAHERISGYPAPNFKGNEQALLDFIHAEDRKQMPQIMEVIKTGKPFDHEYRIIRPDGTVRHIWNRGFPISDINGRVHSYVGVGQDVTARKHAEENLKKSREYLNRIINCIGDPVFVKDRQHRFLMVNDANCTTFNWKREETIGKTMADTLPKELTASIFEQEDQVFGTGKPYVTVDELDINGSRRVFMTNKTLLSGEAGNEQIVGVLRDITEIKRAEEDRANMEAQLRQAQKLEAIGQLAAGIAHEINTPMQYVTDNTRFLQKAYFEVLSVLKAYDHLLQANRQGRIYPELVSDVEAAIAEADMEFLITEAPKALAQSLEGLDRVADIVRAMKEFSHPGGEEKQMMNLNHLINNTITVCRNEWKYVAEISLDLDPDLPPVPCLPGDFNQVILNIVVNAAHAIADKLKGHHKNKGKIRITTRQDGKWVDIRISDTGTGIPEEHRAKIFNPFFTTKEAGRGTGQGLAISHSVVVAKHGGTIDFDTEEGKGTTFVVRLPLPIDSIH